jgi:hypothetical protein
MELRALYFTYVMMRCRLSAARHDERGVNTLELVLWTAGLATLAILTIAFVATRVGDAQSKIPTGP